MQRVQNETQVGTHGGMSKVRRESQTVKSSRLLEHERGMDNNVGKGSQVGEGIVQGQRPAREEEPGKASSLSVLAPASMFEAARSLLHLLVVGDLGKLLTEHSGDRVVPISPLEAHALHVGEGGVEVFRLWEPAPVREERR